MSAADRPIKAAELRERNRNNPTLWDSRCRGCGANVFRPIWDGSLWQIDEAYSWCPDCWAERAVQV